MTALPSDTRPQYPPPTPPPPQATEPTPSLPPAYVYARADANLKPSDIPLTKYPDTKLTFLAASASLVFCFSMRFWEYRFPKPRAISYNAGVAIGNGLAGLAYLTIGAVVAGIAGSVTHGAVICFNVATMFLMMSAWTARRYYRMKREWVNSGGIV
ncbi:hypothetical protein BJ742DRAFT_780143 [Cladochytrium replicatum]|nr:hypothetical protein BJ742DRAFT_780143 [Cladochytrium replicatum]